VSQSLASVGDRRAKPRIPLARILKSGLLMHWTRLGSFNALEENRPGGRWQAWLGGSLCSADAEGDGAAATSLPDLRQALYRHYALRRRKKTLKPIALRLWPLVLGDALYLNPDLARLVRARGKHFLAVLKNENRDLLVDARSLFGEVEPAAHEEGKTTSLWWDIEGFRSWTQLGQDLRVVRSVETRTVRRQATKKPHTQTVEWIWATSLPARQAPTAAVVRIGHRRWSIENEAFNELVNAWHADHVCKHNLTAILALWLLLCLAYNLFHAFIDRNLEPALRARHTLKHWADLLLAGFYNGLPRPRGARAP